MSGGDADVADATRRRVADDVCYRDKNTGEVAVVRCTHAGKTGKQRNVAFIGPTVFWLMHSALNNLIARFERFGAVKLMEAYFSQHPAILELHITSHKNYENVVLRQLDAPQAAFFRATHIAPVKARKFGNAGVGEAHAIKCLHAQVASALGGARTPAGCAIVRYICSLHDRIADYDAQRKLGEDAPEPAATLVADDVDRFENFFAFCEAVGDAVWDFDDEFLQRERDVCAAAAAVLLHVEGHAPRARRKHRIG